MQRVQEERDMLRRNQISQREIIYLNLVSVKHDIYMSKKIFKNLWTGDDGIPPKFNEDFMQNGPEWQKVKGLDFENIGRILICHLSIEHYINKLIEFQTPTDFNWDDSRLSFSQKLKLLSKNSRLNRHQIVKGIETLNKIRNKFSHNLEAKIDPVCVDVIREILFKFRVSVKKNESEKEIKQFLDLYNDIALIESFTNFVCAFIAGYCHSLYSQKKKH